MAQLLNARGVLSEAVTSKEKLNSMDSSLENFSKGRTAVLCCTGVLGRGFHVDDVRFVFHAAVPMDLTEYIQQAGRAGRDGKQAHCVLFYRAQDCMAVQRIRSRGYGESTSEIATAIEEDIAKIVTYCMSQECRYSQLACVATIDQCNPSDQRCTKAAPCDNCHTPGESVNLPLTTAFDSINGHATMLQPKRGHNNSLSDDLMNLFLKTKVLETEGGRRLRQGANFGHVHKLLTSADISFFVKCKQQKGVPSSSGSTEETKSTKPGEKVVAFEALNPMRLHQQEKSVMVSNPLDRLCIPFLVRFEAER
jgi:superfamily II DNA helicase RecQ